eukprot:6445135-Amphidinium_carterae.1
MQHFMKIFQKKSGKDMSSDKRAIQKLRREVNEHRTVSTTIERFLTPQNPPTERTDKEKR